MMIQNLKLLSQCFFEHHIRRSNSNFEKISYLKFNNNTRDMKMEEIKPRCGVIWPGLKGR
jgi:hypothetical protein